MDDHTLLETIQMAIKLSKLEQHPVGSIYTSTKPTDPHELFGGTWVPIQDVFLYCAGPKHAAGEMGGEETHKLTVEEMPEHAHKYARIPQSYANTNFNTDVQANFNESVRKSSNTEVLDTDVTGGGAAHNNMPPYKAVYAWERVK